MGTSTLVDLSRSGIRGGAALVSAQGITYHGECPGLWSASVHGAGHRSCGISDVTAAAEGTFPHGTAPAVQGHPTHIHSTQCGRGGNLASQGSVQRAGEGLIFVHCAG